MSEHDFSVEVLQDDGSIEVVDRTLYKSKYGWMLNAPQFGWPETVGFTFRDANEGNLNMLGTWFDMNKASNIDEFIEAQRTAKRLGEYGKSLSGGVVLILIAGFALLTGELSFRGGDPIVSQADGDD